MHRRVTTFAVAFALWISSASAFAQALGQPDRGKPGDRMIQEYLASQALALDEGFFKGNASAEEWNRSRPEFQREFLSMLGLWPMPERNPLKATVTGTVEGDGFVVENLHYQSRPGLYVTGNLYRPANAKPGERFPAIFYVCGHSGMGRDGNKAAFMPHGIWFARHGYICLVVDTLQLGEIPAFHHGTYNLNRWWWHSRGYTSAGVECWNGVRGIDYLVGRPDVDPEKIGVTGISGGGAATFWIAGADDRVKVAVPVSGMADLESYVGNRVVNGHCDCMFLYNASLWPWTRIAALIPPRPMLFINSDQDAIFPMDANQRIIARLERLYSHFGAGDKVDAVVSVGGHAYRRDIRESVYRFFNTHFKNDPRTVADAEVDAVPESGQNRKWPIDPSRLRVFKTDADIPADAQNQTIDKTFVPIAARVRPKAGEIPARREEARRALAKLSPATFPLVVKAAESVDDSHIRTEPGIVVPLKRIADTTGTAKRVLLIVADPTEPMGDQFLNDSRGDIVYLLQPRGVGETEWTAKNPPNYVARAHALLGRTVDSGRLQDVRSAAAHLAKKHKGMEIIVAGRRSAGVIATYAALFDDAVGGVIALDIPKSHMIEHAPQFLNVLRVLDIPEALELLAPKPLRIRTDSDRLKGFLEEAYRGAGALDKLNAR